MSDKNFTIYKSSAGSGKTFTLVKEYLALALNDGANPPQAYRHILAVTFTNKAAAEMKERIIKALKELSEDDYSSISTGTKTMLGALKEHTKLNAVQQVDDKIIRERAQRILTAILHNYSDFAIGTIDKFVQKVVRTFAFDLKIPMSFEIEMDDDKLLTQAIDLLIGQIGNDEKLTKALVEYTESKTDDEKSWHVEKDLKTFAKNLLTEDGAVYIDKLRELTVDDFFSIKETLGSEIKKFEASISKEAEKGYQLIKSSGLTAKDFYYADKSIAAYFEKLMNGRMDYLAPNSYVRATVGEDKWYGGKLSPTVKATIDGIASQLLDCFNTIQIIVENGNAEYVLFTQINKNMYSLAVLNEIEKLMNQYKAENNIVHISEFNKMIAKIVMNEPIPFIYERLGEKYNNYLVDEFQDTSVLQFQNLLPLIDNSLATGHFTMLVGDGKQAIYRFRGGEVEQFAMLPEIYKHNDNELVLERQASLKRNHNPQVLKNNYRSKREVIEFNNSLFRTLGNELNEKYKSIYNDLEQGFNADNTGGYVQVDFIQEQQEEGREQNRIRTLEIINQLKMDNYKLKDMAILVRKNTDGSDIANYLTENGIDVISSESLLLSNSKEINFIYSLLKYLTNTHDNIVHTEIIEYLVDANYLPSHSIDEMLLAKNKTGLLSVIKSAKIDFSVTHLNKMALYELCEELIRIFKLNAKPNAYIQFFLDEVLNYSIKKNNNLNDFIEYWEEKRLKSSLIIPQGMNAVSIMTTHKAKGLEFPVVILPFCTAKVSNGKDNLWIDVENDKLPNLPSALVPATKSLEETQYKELYEEEVNKSLLDSLNVLYVALTRAEERMYILTGKPSGKPENLGTVSDMLAFYYQQKGEWEEAKTIYTYGASTGSATRKELTTNNKQLITNYTLETFNSNQWRDNIKMRAAAPTIWDTQATETKKDYGVMVHSALAKIKTEDDIEPALKSMGAEGLITNEERINLQKTLVKIINLPQLKPHFAKGLMIKNEAEIITLTGDFFRPDRVVIKDKTAIVIDYKTGEEKPKHKQQIIGYADLLTQMGYAVTESLLVYMEEEKVISC